MAPACPPHVGETQMSETQKEPLQPKTHANAETVQRLFVARRFPSLKPRARGSLAGATPHAIRALDRTRAKVCGSLGPLDSEHLVSTWYFEPLLHVLG